MLEYFYHLIRNLVRMCRHSPIPSLNPGIHLTYLVLLTKIHFLFLWVILEFRYVIKFEQKGELQMFGFKMHNYQNRTLFLLDFWAARSTSLGFPLPSLAAHPLDTGHLSGSAMATAWAEDHLTFLRLFPHLQNRNGTLPVVLENQ